MHNVTNLTKQIKGPILVLGAGGFIGFNLFNFISKNRKDVFGVSQNPKNNWRFIENKTRKKSLKACDISDPIELRHLLTGIKPQTVFNLAAYGAYSTQIEYKKIYLTNFNAVFDIIELLKKRKFSCYVQAGSSSEYGTNCYKPSEGDELVPNSHYAVSKAATSCAIKYYGKKEKLPVVNLRIYSAYGPWEEPGRLIPVLISQARHKKLPPFVKPQVSRDFVYIDDVCAAFVLASVRIKSIQGNSYNIGAGNQVSIKSLANITKSLFCITDMPKYGTMPSRSWDLANWCSDPREAKNDFGWEAKTALKKGLLNVAKWQQEISYDTAFWN